eukprot:m.430506 g.430506  ORF g.430506 m.430506 type:complete len:263 (+) comp17177_c0_seq1:1393-2181(+)
MTTFKRMKFTYPLTPAKSTPVKIVPQFNHDKAMTPGDVLRTNQTGASLRRGQIYVATPLLAKRTCEPSRKSGNSASLDLSTTAVTGQIALSSFRPLAPLLRPVAPRVVLLLPLSVLLFHYVSAHGGVAPPVKGTRRSKAPPTTPPGLPRHCRRGRWAPFHRGRRGRLAAFPHRRRKRVRRNRVQPGVNDLLGNLSLDHLGEDVFELEGVDGRVELGPADRRVVLVSFVFLVVHVKKAGVEEEAQARGFGDIELGGAKGDVQD